MRRDALNGLLRSLAGIPGARTEVHESVKFEARNIEEAIDSIKRLQGTGQFTIHFADGKARVAEWNTRGKS